MNRDEYANENIEQAGFVDRGVTIIPVDADSRHLDAYVSDRVRPQYCWPIGAEQTHALTDSHDEVDEVTRSSAGHCVTRDTSFNSQTRLVYRCHIR